jgi:hypothetical protein
LVIRPSVVWRNDAPAGRRPGLDGGFVCGNLRPGTMRLAPSGLGGAGGEGDWRRAVVGVLVREEREAAPELRGGTNRDEGKKSSKRGEAKGSRPGA